MKPEPWLKYKDSPLPPQDEDAVPSTIEHEGRTYRLQTTLHREDGAVEVAYYQDGRQRVKATYTGDRLNRFTWTPDQVEIES